MSRDGPFPSHSSPLQTSHSISTRSLEERHSRPSPGNCTKTKGSSGKDKDTKGMEGFERLDVEGCDGDKMAEGKL